VSGKALRKSSLLVKAGSTMTSDQGFFQSDAEDWRLYNSSGQQIQKNNPLNYIPERGITRQENCSVTKSHQHDKSI